MEFPLWALILCIIGCVNILLISVLLIMIEVDLPIMDEVRDRTFSNEVVALDGNKFTGCRFFNVSFEFHGGRYEIAPDCIIENPGRMKIQTRKPSVRRTIELIGRLS